MAGGMHGKGGTHGWGHAWQGTRMAEGCAWQGSMHGRGHAWQGDRHGRGKCMAHMPPSLMNRMTDACENIKVTSNLKKN